MEAKQSTYIAPEYHTLRLGDPRKVAGGLVEVKLVPCSLAAGDARIEVRRAADSGPDALFELAEAALELLARLDPPARLIESGVASEEYCRREGRLRELALAATRAGWTGTKEGGRR